MCNGEHTDKKKCNSQEIAWIEKINPQRNIMKSSKKVIFKSTLTDSINIDTSEAKFQNLISQVPVLINIFTGPSFILETINEIGLEIWGKTYDDVINKSLFDSEPELEDKIKKMFYEVYTTGVPFISNEMPVQLKRAGKPDTAYFNTVYKPVRDLNNNIYGIMVIGTEVTETVIARKIIEESEKRSEKQRKMLHDFFTQAPAMFAILKGPEHVFEFANPTFMEFIGNHNLIGKTAIEALPEIVGQGFIELLDFVYKSGETFTTKEMVVMLDKGNANHQQFYANLTYQALKNHKDEIEGIWVFAYDVTEQVNARKQIE